MRNGTASIASALRTFDLLSAVVDDGGRSNVTQIAAQRGVPLSSAHRQIKTLVDGGYLVRIANGQHVAGPALIALSARVDPLSSLTAAARPPLRHLAARAKATAHLGVLENDMVTYLVKAGPPDGAALFTREGHQLEAYCSGIGKILLGHMPEAAREDYLAGGPFVALTPNTITDPGALRADIAASAARGYAIDDYEVSTDLRCIAVPLAGADGRACAAISLSRIGPRLPAHRDATTAARLTAIAAELSRTIFNHPPTHS